MAKYYDVWPSMHPSTYYAKERVYPYRESTDKIFKEFQNYWYEYTFIENKDISPKKRERKGRFQFLG